MDPAEYGPYNSHYKPRSVMMGKQLKMRPKSSNAGYCRSHLAQYNKQTGQP